MENTNKQELQNFLQFLLIDLVYLDLSYLPSLGRARPKGRLLLKGCKKDVYIIKASLNACPLH